MASNSEIFAHWLQTEGGVILHKPENFEYAPLTGVDLAAWRIEYFETEKDEKSNVRSAIQLMMTEEDCLEVAQCLMALAKHLNAEKAGKKSH